MIDDRPDLSLSRDGCFGEVSNRFSPLREKKRALRAGSVSRQRYLSNIFRTAVDVFAGPRIRTVRKRGRSPVRYRRTNETIYFARWTAGSVIRYGGGEIVRLNISCRTLRKTEQRAQLKFVSGRR